MTSIDSVVIETTDPAATRAFLTALGLDGRLAVRGSDAPTDGFRACTLSLVVGRPSTVDALVASAVAAGATVVKPVEKTFWGYGGVVRAPDGTIWKIATSKKKDTGPATREVDGIVLLLGVTDVKASKRFYVEHGLTVGRSFGGKYVEFSTPGAPVKLALYPRKALAKDAGVDMAGSGSHRIAIAGDGDGFTDPDGFVWESAPVTSSPN